MCYVGGSKDLVILFDNRVNRKVLTLNQGADASHLRFSEVFRGEIKWEHLEEKVNCNLKESECCCVRIS